MAPTVYDELQTLTRGIGKVVSTYRYQLEENGVPKDEAWALAQRLEERLLGPLYDAAEEFGRRVSHTVTLDQGAMPDVPSD